MTLPDRRPSPLAAASGTPREPGLAVRVLAGPSAAWEALVATDPEATAAHRPELWRALLAGVEGLALRFVSIEERGMPIGGGAVLVRRRGGACWLHVLPFLLSGAPLAAPGARARVDAAFARALETLRRELDVVGGEWSLYRPSAGPPAVEALEGLAGETRFVETSVLPLVAGAPADAGLERSARAELRHARAAGLECVEDPALLEEAYALHLARSRGWRAHRPLPIELARRLLGGDPAAPPVARLFAVRDRRGVLSATFFLDHPREILAWWNGARDAARARHATTLLYGWVAEWAAAAGRARLNLGGSPGLPRIAAYKRSLGAHVVRYPVRWIAPGGRGPAARAIAALQRWVRRGRPRGEAA